MWNGFGKEPQTPASVEFYYAKMKVELPEYRDVRRSLGYWDGDCWRHLHTGHDVFEFGDTDPEDLPTHWRLLDPPPL